ncbi:MULTISPECIES: Zn-ribbon containing protein [unclassified Haloferax]|uniref:OapC/ArvC family zinc-ribbon domain-containing protein n=1 Tax=unclassified Haloferax TaxID=2625095 RepID=UPI0009DA1131|nr:MULTISPECIES: Zn-ribbon containing protein [unclassified Haloferax]
MPHQCTTCGKVFPDGSKEMLSGCPSCGGNKFQFKPASSGSAPASASDDTPSTGGAGTRDLSSSAADAVRDRAQQQSHPDSTDEESMTVSDWANANADANAPQRSETGDTAGSTRSEPSSTGAAGSSDAADGGGEPEDKPRGWGEWPSAPGESPGADPQEPPASRNKSRGEPATERPSSSADSASPPDRDPGTINARETDEDNSQKSARSDVVTPEELAAADANRRGSGAETPSEAPPASEGAAGQPADAPTDADGTVIEPSSDERPDLDQLREELNDQFESIKIVNPGQYELNLMELYDRSEYIISLREDGRYVIEVPDTWGPGNRED